MGQEHHTVRTHIFPHAVGVVPNDRMTYALTVDAELMPAPCNVKDSGGFRKGT